MPDKPKRGRPHTLPDGTRVRGIRLTDAEYEAVKRYVVQLRKRDGGGTPRTARTEGRR